MLTDDEMVKLKEIQLEIMDYIHFVCVNNHIEYFLAAGSCIGAVRHNGYIPWDYDIDIYMKRDQYDKFAEIMKNDTCELFRYKCFRNEKDYFRPHAIVVSTRAQIFTKFDVLNRKMRYDHGIYIDVLPLDHSDGVDAKVRKKIARIKKIIKYKKAYIYSENESALKHILKFGLRTATIVIPLSFLNERMDSYMRQNNSMNTEFLAEFTSKYSAERSVWKKEVFDSAILHEFEGREYYISARYDDMLRTMYGDYMTIPSQNKIAEQRDVFDHIAFD